MVMIAFRAPDHIRGRLLLRDGSGYNIDGQGNFLANPRHQGELMDLGAYPLSLLREGGVGDMSTYDPGDMVPLINSLLHEGL